MQVIEIQFPARRYHATPWDAHVNEGRVEWPPCPWRLLRAFLAVGYNKLGWVDKPDERSHALILKLARCQPYYLLPKATETHTRHYMPSREGGQDKSVKVFDAFLRFSSSQDRLLVRFDIELLEEEREALDRMARGMSYLGRAESWADARLLPTNESETLMSAPDWCGPAENGSKNRVRLLAALSDDAYSTWRNEHVGNAADRAEETALARQTEKGKTLTPAAAKKARAKADEQYPQDLLAVLQQETADWQNAGWPSPPGSRWVDYALPDEPFDRQPLSPPSVSPKVKPVEAVLLAIDGAGKQGTLRPLMQRTLPLMESLHLASVRHAAKLGLGHLPELTGKDDAGRPLNGHQHAHWLPLSLFGKGRIDHVLVYAPGGLSAKALRALAAIRTVYAKGLSGCSVNLAGQGEVSQIARQLRQSPNVQRLSPHPLGESTTWQTLTPLVLRKHLHKRGRKTVEGQIREELVERGFAEPVSVDIWPQQDLVKRRLKGYLLRRREGKRQPPREASWGATIVFPETQSTPFCLGYAGHLGLGMFGAV